MSEHSPIQPQGAGATLDARQIQVLLERYRRDGVEVALEAVAPTAVALPEGPHVCRITAFVVSTACICAADADHLGALAWRPGDDPDDDIAARSILDTPYGYRLALPREAFEDWMRVLRERGVSETVLELALVARCHGAEELLIDRDALEVDGLPVFDW